MKTLDQLIQDLGDCLATMSGEEIVRVCNSVMTRQHRYIGDDMVEEADDRETDNQA